MMMRGMMALAVALAACGENSTTNGDDDAGGPVHSVALPQAIGNAMWVNPDAFPTIPVHVAVEGDPSEVTVAIDGVAVDAVKGEHWTAMVPVAALADGTYELVATAGDKTATATLAVGRQGIQWTQFGSDRNAATPRLHRDGEHLFLTWTDISSGSRVAWLQELDGAGRRLGNKTALVGGPGKEDVLYARTAFGKSSVGVVYQQRGGPYKNYFTIVSRDGAELLAPIALDPMDRYGSNSGDIVFTGSGYDIVWRTNSGMGSSDIRFMHVDEATREVTGPKIIAEPGSGGFDAITNVTIRHANGTSLVAFLRYEYDPLLELDVKRCQLATIQNGNVRTDLVAIGTGIYWDEDCRIVDDGAGPLVVRSAKDLTSSDDNPPDIFFGARVPLAANRGDGRTILSAPETRSEPTVVATSARPIMAWTDARKYASEITQGEVELYVTTLDDMTAGTHIGFPHTHFIEGTGDVRGAPAGSNAIITWIDERHGGTVLDPRPEVYLETVWQ